jgi:hypothetical protein
MRKPAGGFLSPDDTGGAESDSGRNVRQLHILGNDFYLRGYLLAQGKSVTLYFYLYGVSQRRYAFELYFAAISPAPCPQRRLRISPVRFILTMRFLPVFEFV